MQSDTVIKPFSVLYREAWSRGSSLDPFPSFDAEPVIRQSADFDVAAEEVIGGPAVHSAAGAVAEVIAEMAKEVEAEEQIGEKKQNVIETFPSFIFDVAAEEITGEPQSAEEAVAEVIAEVAKEAGEPDPSDGLAVMNARLEAGIRVYQDPNYGNRKCLFDPTKPWPQKVKQVPTTYQLFLSVSKHLPNHRRSAEWKRVNEEKRTQEWAGRRKELKEEQAEQAEQIRLGLIYL